MKMTLSNGKKIEVSISHLTSNQFLNGPKTKNAEFNKEVLNLSKAINKSRKFSRVTIASIKESIGTIYDYSACSKSDQFNRRDGAKRALSRVIRRSSLDKKERREVYQKIFAVTHQSPYRRLENFVRGKPELAEMLVQLISQKGVENIKQMLA